MEEICVCSSPQQGKFSQCKWLTAPEQKQVAIFTSPGEIRPSHPAPDPIRRGRIWGKYIHQSWMDRAFIYLWEEGRRGTTMPIPTRKYSSLLFEVGSLSTKQLLTSCEQTVPRPHLAGAERQRAGGQRAEAHWFYGVTLSTAGRMDVDETVWVGLQAAESRWSNFGKVLFWYSLGLVWPWELKWLRILLCTLSCS